MRQEPDGLGSESAVRFCAQAPLPTTRDMVLVYVGAGVGVYQTGGNLPAGRLSDRRRVAV